MPRFPASPNFDRSGTGASVSESSSGICLRGDRFRRGLVVPRLERRGSRTRLYRFRGFLAVRDVLRPKSGMQHTARIQSAKHPHAHFNTEYMQQMPIKAPMPYAMVSSADMSSLRAEISYHIDRRCAMRGGGSTHPAAAPTCMPDESGFRRSAGRGPSRWRPQGDGREEAVGSRQEHARQTRRCRGRGSAAGG